jgi:hypothetical protein
MDIVGFPNHECGSTIEQGAGALVPKTLPHCKEISREALPATGTCEAESHETLNNAAYDARLAQINRGLDAFERR